MGNLNKVKDPLSNVVTYKYASNGEVRKTVAAGSTWTFGYDNVGNRTSMTDPDAGTITYTYDALGRETGKTDARGVVFVTNYDYLGRVSSTSASQSGNTETVTYNYGTSGTGQSRLTSKTLGNFISSYEYDQYGRLTMESNGVHSVSYQYSASGLVSRMTWDPNNSTDRYVDYMYDSYGNCIGQSAISGIIQWNLTGNAGTSTTSTMRLHSNGTVFTKNTTLDSNGNLSSQTLLRGGVTLGSGSYTFSATTGNLTSRTLNGTTRTFTYDNLDRLTAVSVNNTTEMSMSYSANGNISSKTGIGSYQYSSNNKPHAVSSVDNTAGLIDTEIQSISYNLWGKVTEVNAVKGNDTYKYEIMYGPDLQRILTVLWKNNQLVHLITYGRDYEERYLTTHIARYYYVCGADGNAAVYVSDPGYQEKAYCIETDHLGSITALYDQYGTKCFSASYDVWGKRTVGIDNVGFDRGFTGHEHIDEIGLINMNGRMYEPNLGRFISVDPYVQEPANLQNYNRYSYCLNNPLKYTDPSGEFFTLLASLLCPPLLPIGISMDIGWMSGAHKSNYYPDVSKFEGACKGVLSGALGGSLSIIGGSNLISNVLWGGAQGAITGVFDAALWGDDFGNAFWNGLVFGASFSLLTSQNLKNLIKGKGFYNNERVFENFRDGKYVIPDGVEWQQECLDYFGFEGTYDPQYEYFLRNDEPAITLPKTGDIYYNVYSFEGNYDRLYFIADHEAYHRLNVLSGKYEGKQITDIIRGKEEWNAYIHNYRNQGLYKKHGIDIVERINKYGQDALFYDYIITPSSFIWNGFEEKLWHKIFKIPRRI